MARQQYNTNPWEKKFEVFQDFSKGMNTVTSQDNMRDEELSNALNVMIAERGSLKPRHGTVEHLHSGTGKGQGYFRFYSGTAYKEIEAIGGVFYVDGVQKAITGLPEGFQEVHPIEGVQFKNRMYFATGTRLVQYDGTDFSVVEPYKPQPLEALYIGLNGLADNPQNFMTDGAAAFPRIDGVTFDNRYGIVNEPINLHIFVSKPAATVLEYKIQRRMSTDTEGKWFLQADWSEDNKDYTFVTSYQGDMEIQVLARDKADPTYTVDEWDEETEKMVTRTYDKIAGEYYVPKYKIKPTADPEDVEPDTSLVHECRHILLHWNRLILFGESKNPDMIYVSHLNQPEYFPIPNTLRFENPRNEKLNVLVPFRGMLVAFTQTSIQALYGTSPFDFRRVTLNTGIGCIAPYTARVMKNYITFLSLEGVHVLKTIGYSEDKANVEKIDYLVDNQIPLDTEASAWFHNGEYHLFLPNHNRRMRYHFELQTWMKDESPSLDFHRVVDFDGILFGQKRADGKLLKFDESVHMDEGVPFEVSLETRFFSFNQPYHSKKLKELQIMFGEVDDTVNLECYVFADESAALSPETSSAVVDTNGNVIWQTSFEPNVKLVGDTELGEWEMGESPFGEIMFDRKILKISGRCLKTKVKITHREGQPFKFIGLGYIFKLKRP